MRLLRIAKSKRHFGLLSESATMTDQQDIIRALYKKIFDEDFNPNDEEHRQNLQNAVYILENLGVHVGEYGFTLKK